MLLDMQTSHKSFLKCIHITRLVLGYYSFHLDSCHVTVSLFNVLTEGFFRIPSSFRGPRTRSSHSFVRKSERSLRERMFSPAVIHANRLNSNRNALVVQNGLVNNNRGIISSSMTTPLFSHSAYGKRFLVPNHLRYPNNQTIILHQTPIAFSRHHPLSQHHLFTPPPPFLSHYYPFGPHSHLNYLHERKRKSSSCWIL
jgi:hypothetical protein